MDWEKANVPTLRKAWWLEVSSYTLYKINEHVCVSWVKLSVKY
jgi:fumarate reductase subunit C